jgi:hypothetical protein
VRIKVDEDLPPAVTERLREAGHDAAGVVEQGMAGWKDPGLWEAVQREGRFLVTSDKGFGDIRAYDPEVRERVELRHQLRVRQSVERRLRDVGHGPEVEGTPVAHGRDPASVGCDRRAAGAAPRRQPVRPGR